MQSYCYFHLGVKSKTIEKILNDFNEREDSEFTLRDLSDFFREEFGDDCEFAKQINYKIKPLDLLISYIDGRAEWLEKCPMLMYGDYDVEDAVYFLENLSSLLKKNKEVLEKDLCLYISSIAQEEGGGSNHFGIEEYNVDNGQGTYFFIEGKCDACDENMIDWNDLDESEWECLNDLITDASFESHKLNKNMLNFIGKYGIYEKI